MILFLVINEKTSTLSFENSNISINIERNFDENDDGSNPL